MQTVTVNDAMYKCGILFAVNCTGEELEKYLNKHYGDKKTKFDLSWIDNRVSGTALDFDVTPYRVVWLKKYRKNNADDLGILVHEITHAVLRICEDKGIALETVSPSNKVLDEPIAYMMDFYTREFFKRLKK